MRYLGCAVLTALLIAAIAGGAVAAERPLASLVPADASTYSELDLDRMLGRAPETADLRQAFAQMKSPRLIAQMWADLAKDEPEMAKVTEVLDLVKTLPDAFGPRLGWATWMPDAQSLMGGMMGGAAGGDMQSAMGMMPKVLLVADVRDPARLDALVSEIASQAGLDAPVTESAGRRTVSFANGMVELIRGDDWMALGFPADGARKSADMASGQAGDSLYANQAYKAAMERLPSDAMLTEFVSAPAVRQLVALVNMMVPDAGFAYPGDQAIGLAMGVRIEEIQGRKLATTYYTADLDAIPYLLDAPLTLEAVMLKPILERQKDQGKRQALSDQCASHLEELAAAMQSYLDEHDNSYPPVDRWVDELRPYVDDVAVFRCPEDTSDAFSSYGMNAALSEFSPDDVADPESTVLFYETAHPGANPSGGPEAVADPARHIDGNNFALVDGSVGAYSPEDEEQPIWNPADSSAQEEEPSDSEDTGEGA